MADQLFLYLHGFASSAQGTKARYLRERFEVKPGRAFEAIDFNPTPRDFEYMTITGQINRLRQFLLERGWERVCLIGSSLGALVGLQYAHRFGGVERLWLLAPALAYRPEPNNSVLTPVSARCETARNCLNSRFIPK